MNTPPPAPEVKETSVFSKNTVLSLTLFATAAMSACSTAQIYDANGNLVGSCEYSLTKCLEEQNNEKPDGYYEKLNEARKIVDADREACELSEYSGNLAMAVAEQDRCVSNDNLSANECTKQTDRIYYDWKQASDSICEMRAEEQMNHLLK